jgi:AraC family transcriptional regulator, transcriptional activator FtrA
MHNQKQTPAITSIAKTNSQRDKRSVSKSVASFLRQVPWRRLAFLLIYVLAFLLVPFIVGSVNFGIKMAGSAPSSKNSAYTGPIPAPIYDPTKKIAVVVASNYGAEITDALPTFEILARSKAFNVYIVAPERKVLPFITSNSNTGSGLDFIPHFSYADYAREIGKKPDLIAIPYLPGYTLPRDAAVVNWIRANTGPQTIIDGICIGTATLADTGLLNGHKATTNTNVFNQLQAHFPKVRWMRNVRYVDDGNIITSTNLASGIDATLHVVARLVGRSVAEDVARQIGYTHTNYLDNPSFQSPALPIGPLFANAAFSWHQDQLGVLLYDGVSEMDLAGLLDPYMSSLVAKASVFAPKQGPITSRDGLILLPRYDFQTVPSLDRVVVPGGEMNSSQQQAIAAWNRLHPDRQAEAIHRNVGQGETAYDATLQDLAHHYNARVASAIAAVLFFPAETTSPDASFPIESLGAPLLLGLLGIGLVFALSRLLSRRHTPVRSGTVAAS